MIKVASALALLSSTLLYASSAQVINDAVNDLNTDINAFIDKAVITNETADSISFTLGEYEWTLTENNEDTFSVHHISSPIANKLQASLTDFLVEVGESIQDDANEIEITSEGLFEGQLNETVRDNNGTANIVREFGHELQVNASKISVAWIENYNELAYNYTNNVDNVTDLLNEQLNVIDKESDDLDEADPVEVLGNTLDFANDVADAANANGINTDVAVSRVRASGLRPDF